MNELVGDNSATFSDGELTGFSNTNVEGITTGDHGALTLVEAGSDQFIGWGRWSNSSGTTESFTVTRPGGVNESFSQQNQSLHYVTGKPTDLLALAELDQTEARYSMSHATTPTARTGTTGELTDASMLLDITNARVSGTAAVSLNSNDYNLEFDGVAVGRTGFSSTALVGSGTGGCSSGCSGFVSGLIAGPAAERAGFVYHVQSNDDIFGAVTFTKDPNGPLPIIR